MSGKRKHLRASSAIEVWLGNEGVYQRKDEVILSLGMGGAFIKSRIPYPASTILTLRFRLNENDDYITCRAIVRHSHTGTGMGVEFADLTKDDRQRIKLFVENQLISEALQYTARRVTGSLKAGNSDNVPRNLPEPLCRIV